MKFISPSYGLMTFEKMYKNIIRRIRKNPNAEYKLIVGTDSQAGTERIVFVTAIIFYQIGKGGVYFYNKEKMKNNFNLKTKIFNEVSKSLVVASDLTERLSKEEVMSIPDVEIHIDVGHKGATNTVVKDVVGMVIGSGFEAMIKPDSFAASTVADKYTKY